MRTRHALASAFLLFISITITGCSLLGIGKKGEPAAEADATPPPGYAPIYVQRSGTFTPDAKDATVQITRVDATNPTRVKVYAHLVDSNGTYLSGGAGKGWRAWWCGISESFNGMPERLDTVTVREVTESEASTYAIALVMDHSGSMGEPRARAVQAAADELIDRKRPVDGLAFVKYDGAVAVEVPLTTDAAALRAGLRKNGLDGFGGYTAIGDGLHAGIEQVAVDRRAARKAVIVFTDGLDNSSTVTRDSAVALALSEGVIVCAVDFGEGTDAAYLKSIAEATGGSYYKIYRTSEFALVFDDIYRRLRNYYLIEYAPSKYGLHTVDLKLCLGGDTAVASARYDNTPDVGTVALLNIHFDVAKAELKAESTPAIENVLGLMRAFPTLRIELRGHTDSTNATGDPAFNTTLSQRRADAVRAELMRRGIKGDRITSIGFGESRPIADNATPEGRARNRRTEFVILRR